MRKFPDDVLTVFVMRDRSGAIKGVFANRQKDATEELAESDAEVVAFRNRKPPELTAAQKLAAAGLSVAELKQLLGLE